MRNLVAALFRLENSRGPEDVCRVLEALSVWLQAGAETDDLRRAFVGWRRQVLLPRRIPGVGGPGDRRLAGGPNNVSGTR